MKRKTMRFLIVLFIIMVCTNFLYAAEGKLSVKLADVMPAKDNIGRGKDKFAELAKQKSNGSIEIQVFHASQLGSGKETFEATRAGSIEMAGDSYANIVTLTPTFEALHLPFIFDTREQALRAFTSPNVRGYIDKRLSSIGLKMMMLLEFGPRQICTTKKKILRPEDLKGMKFRASRSPTEISSQKAWGLSSVTIDWVEVYDALKMGMVDGYTLIYPLIWSTNHHDVIRVIGELNWQYIGDVTVCNKKWWDNLPENSKKALSDAASEAEKWHQSIMVNDTNFTIQEMKKAGVDIYRFTPQQREAFKKTTMQVWKEFENTTCPKDWVDLILKEAGPAKGTPGDFGFKL